MSVIGQLREFDRQKESFEAYIERLENFMKANGVRKENEVAVLLTAIGPETYGLLRNLLTPEKPDTKTYKDLVDILSGHLHPKPLVIAERFNFHNRFRHDSETVADFGAQLKKLSTHCEFGTFQDEALRDRFVCGLRQEAIQRKLLTEKTLTFAKALEIAQSMEMAESKSSELKGSGSSGSGCVEEVHQLGKKPQKHKKFTQNKGGKPKTACHRCGSAEHDGKSCKYKKYKCDNCGKVGHLKRVCQSKECKETKYVEVSVDNNQEDESLGFFSTREPSSKAVTVTITVNGKEIPMEVDTGAARTVIPEKLFKENFGHLKLKNASTSLKTYSGTVLPLIGETEVLVEYEGQSAKLPLIVAKVESKPAILGRNWLSVVKLNWEHLFSVSSSDLVHELTARFKGVFGTGLGKIKEFQARINVQPEATPRFHKARPVPYALKPAVEAELDRMEKEGIVTKVSHSEWAAPLVVVPKADGGVRLCGDYKVTVNPVLDVDQYPLPNPQDLLSALAGGTKFSKLDLKHAYQQLPLGEESKKFLTVNTCKGLYQYNRLPFGVASAPAVFQSTIDTILKGIDGVVCYIDDILITGRNDREHKARLEAVLERLEKYGISLKLSKCSFLEDRVGFLGHVIDAEGVHPSPEKVRAVVDAPAPTNVTELRSFLGMLQYYGKFLPNLSTLLHPLNNLLRDGVEWSWLPECEQAFTSAKELLQSAKVLTHYDVNLPIKLACDASPYGIGAVISHVMPGGEERPIAFASRTLTGSEKNYAQLEKEALSIIYGVKKFHQFLYGRRFILETDHKPLLTILGPKSAIPTLAAARLQRWALILASHQYDVVYRKGVDHSNADGLSRLPVDKPRVSEETEIYHFSYVDDLPVTAKDMFMKSNGIRHTRVPRYHPASNGEAERYVQTLKQALLTSKFDQGKSLQQRLSSFLFSYRNTPHTVTGQTPAELFLKRKPRTRLALLQPNLAQHVEERQMKEKQQHDGGRTKTREFLPGDIVLVRNFRGKHKWDKGTVILRIGPLAYQIRIGGRMCHVHVDHLLAAGDAEHTSPPTTATAMTGSGFVLPSTPVVSSKPILPEPEVTPLPEVSPKSSETVVPTCTTESPPAVASTPVRCYPRRTPKPVVHLDL
ncbi:uncharacterized protein K02A2.6-like [Nematostella vectensis]|uniref:uncharacterized protein K02A2.6-like n=1 Tax=Nematostella vectensis TaxID=45351 RepID=UPI00207731EB|nr:uncharacterized protein K02A2.6-like [Nematostella vectensis]